MNLDATGREKVEDDGVVVSEVLSICSTGGFNLFARSVKLRDKNMT